MQFSFASLLSTLLMSRLLVEASPFDHIFGNGTYGAQSQSQSSLTSVASQDTTISIASETESSQTTHSHRSATLVTATISSLPSTWYGADSTSQLPASSSTPYAYASNQDTWSSSVNAQPAASADDSFTAESSTTTSFTTTGFNAASDVSATNVYTVASANPISTAVQFTTTPVVASSTSSTSEIPIISTSTTPSADSYMVPSSEASVVVSTSPGNSKGVVAANRSN